eukprot:1089859-Pelagomonas_calceolata.AAC.2
MGASATAPSSGALQFTHQLVDAQALGSEGAQHALPLDVHELRCQLHRAQLRAHIIHPGHS